MGKNKSTRSDGVNNVKKTQALEQTVNKPKGAWQRAPQGPK